VRNATPREPASGYSSVRRPDRGFAPGLGGFLRENLGKKKKKKLASGGFIYINISFLTFQRGNARRIPCFLRENLGRVQVSPKKTWGGSLS
jgi:hypothetical protein